MKLFGIVFFLSFSLHAKILEYSIAPGHRVSIALDQACNMVGHPKVLFAEIINGKLDCMGSSFSLNELCYKKRPETFPIDLVQASFDKQQERIICRFSNRVDFKLECSAKNVSRCINPNKTCLLIRPKIATELQLVRAFSLDKSSGRKVLNCLYSSSSLPSRSRDNVKKDSDFEQYLRSL